MIIGGVRRLSSRKMRRLFQNLAEHGYFFWNLKTLITKRHSGISAFIAVMKILGIFVEQGRCMNSTKAELVTPMKVLLERWGLRLILQNSGLSGPEVLLLVSLRHWWRIVLPHAMSGLAPLSPAGRRLCLLPKHPACRFPPDLHHRNKHVVVNNICASQPSQASSSDESFEHILWPKNVFYEYIKDDVLYGPRCFCTCD